MPTSLRWLRGALFACALSVAGTHPAAAADEPIRLAIQPIQTADATAGFYAPLGEYLHSSTGLDIELVTATNFLAYWTEMKRGSYDLVLDAAHLTDYRIRQMGYIPLAKMPGEVSYTLITHPDTFVFEPLELTGKPIATLASPSLGMLRMLEMFPNPLRQPRIVEAANSEDIVAMIENGRAVAGIIPTPLLNLYPQFNVVVTTEPAPHVTFSASPELRDAERAAIQRALLSAADSADGRAMLDAIDFQPLERPSADLYAGYAELLRDMWGY